MTLKEAVESGKPFKRPDDLYWIVPGVLSEDDNITFAHAIATDYILKQEPAVIWVNEYDYGFGGTFLTENDAKENAGSCAERIAVKFVEEIEPEK